MKGKKFLAILLTLAMLCSNFGSMLPAFAEENDAPAEASVPEVQQPAPEAPAEAPATGGTGDSQGEPAEAPQAEPADETTDKTTDETEEEPQAEAGEPSEPAGDASEGEAEAAQENAAALALNGLKADAESAAVGQTVRWTFQAEGAERVSWQAVRSDGAGAAEGDCEDGAFTWTPAESGIYTVTVTAAAGEQSLTERAEIVVRDGPLSVSLTPGARTAWPMKRKLNLPLL